MMTIVRIETTGQWRPYYHKNWINAELQVLLGGKLSVLVEEPLPGLVAYCDDVGLLLKLEVNTAVNEKLWILFNMTSKPAGIIHGPVVLSRTGLDGNECGLLPSDLVDITKCFGPCQVGGKLSTQFEEACIWM
jgi:hypothetical protein